MRAIVLVLGAVGLMALGVARGSTKSVFVRKAFLCALLVLIGLLTLGLSERRPEQPLILIPVPAVTVTVGR